MEKVLTVKDARKQYGDTVAVDDVSLEVRRGEIMGTLGPNGAGKTSLIRMIMDIIAPDQGKIEFNLNSAVRDKKPSDWREKVGYLPEERGLYQQAKVKDIFAFLGGLKGLEKKQAHEQGLSWLEKFDLQDHFNDKIEELSKGMAQKVQFVTSIIHEPDLLILDEPFSGLDPVSQDLMIEEIADLAEGGMAIMLSSHRMNLVEELCDRIFFIDKGQEVLYGPLDDIKENYGNYRVKLKTKDDSSMQKFADSSNLIENYQRHQGRWQLLLGDEVQPEDFMQAAADELYLQEISISRISLHDIFVRVARGGFLHEKAS